MLTYNVVNGTTLKYNFNKEISEKLKLGNSVFNMEVSYKPTKMNDDKQSLALKHASKYNPSTGNVESTESIKYGVPQVGPIRPWFTVSSRFLLLMDTKYLPLYSLIYLNLISNCCSLA